MFGLVIVQIPVAFMMEAFNITSLMILKGEILKTFELSQPLRISGYSYSFGSAGIERET